MYSRQVGLDEAEKKESHPIKKTNYVYVGGGISTKFYR